MNLPKKSLSRHIIPYSFRSNVLLWLFCVYSCTGQKIEKGTIVFDSYLNNRSNKTFELYGISPEGKSLAQYTFDAVPRRSNSNGQLSPDAKNIIFGTYNYGGFKIAIANNDFSNRRKLTLGQQYTYPGSWSPDSKKIVYNKIDAKSAPYFQGDMEIFVMTIDGKYDKNITNKAGHDYGPRWSLDGKAIVFSSNRTGNYEIYTMNPDGGNLRNLTNTKNIDEFAPSWSPDSSMIAYHSMSKNVSKRYVELNITNLANGGSPINLTNNVTKERNLFVPYYEGASPIFYQSSWSPDGTHIVYSSKRNSKNFELYIISIGDGQLRQLTKNGADNVFPNWH